MQQFIAKLGKMHGSNNIASVSFWFFTLYTCWIERNGRSMNSYATMNRFASLFENGLYAISPLQKAM